MSVMEILDTAQFVVDKHGQETAVLLDVKSWQMLRRLLDEIVEDEQLGQLMADVENDETLAGEAAHHAYETYLAEVKS